MEGMLPPPVVHQQPSSTRLTQGWSRALSIGWAGLTLALICTGISSHIIGRPVFWLDDQRWSVSQLVLVAFTVTGPTLLSVFWSYANRPHLSVVSGLASTLLVVASIVDRHDSPGAAVVEAALAVAGGLLTAAGFTGRYRRSGHS